MLRRLVNQYCQQRYCHAASHHNQGNDCHANKKNPNRICDLSLAKATKDIDLIIGGHTHTFLPKPTIEKNSVGKSVLVNQVGCYGLYVGKVDFYFEPGKDVKANGASIIV